MKKIASLLMVFLLISLAGCQKNATIARSGEVAPDFTLQDLSGRAVNLAALRGKIVLLNFWASWCPPCREEAPSLTRLNGIMSGQEFQMLAVAVDKEGREAVEKFFRSADLNLPTLLDPSGRVGNLYGITGVPETFIIDKKGIIRKKIVGPIDWSDPAVIQYLRELAAG